MEEIKHTRWAPYEDGGAGALTAAKEACQEELRAQGLDFVAWEKAESTEHGCPVIRAAGTKHKLRLYLAGPMRGYPEFNFPAFEAGAVLLRERGFEVFSPAEKDIERHGTNIGAGNTAGSEEQAAKEHGFSLRVALKEDTTWICDNAEGIALLPGWEKSKGAVMEHSLAIALGLKVFSLVEIGHGAYDVAEGLVQ